MKPGPFKPSEGNLMPLPLIIGAGHKGLENGKENIAIFGRLTPFLYLVRGYPYQSIFGESGEVIECLVSENIAVSEK